MSEQPQDEKIRPLFRELRRSDAQAAPSFQTTWRAAADRNEVASRGALFVGLFAAAAMVVALVVAGSIWFRVNRTEPQPVEVASVFISEWQSPTAFLLETPGADLWKSVPSLDRSWMQSVSEITKTTE